MPKGSKRRVVGGVSNGGRSPKKKAVHVRVGIPRKKRVSVCRAEILKHFNSAEPAKAIPSIVHFRYPDGRFFIAKFREARETLVISLQTLRETRAGGSAFVSDLAVEIEISEILKKTGFKIRFE